MFELFFIDLWENETVITSLDNSNLLYSFAHTSADHDNQTYGEFYEDKARLIKFPISNTVISNEHTIRISY
jgi:hypothetical protein